MNFDQPCETAIHAEANAIAWAARHGARLEGGIMYCTHGPCLKCAQLMLAAGISQAHFVIPYRILEGVFLLQEAGVMLFHSRYRGLYGLEVRSS